MTRKHLRIKNVPQDLHDTLKTIAKNSGETKCEYFRPIIREIVESYPDHLKVHQKQESQELRITGVPEDLLNKLENIAKNSNVTVAQLLRPKLHEIVENCNPFLKTNLPEG